MRAGVLLVASSFALPVLSNAANADACSFARPTVSPNGLVFGPMPFGDEVLTVSNDGTMAMIAIETGEASWLVRRVTDARPAVHAAVLDGDDAIVLLRNDVAERWPLRATAPTWRGRLAERVRTGLEPWLLRRSTFQFDAATGVVTTASIAEDYGLFERPAVQPSSRYRSYFVHGTSHYSCGPPIRGLVFADNRDGRHLWEIDEPDVGFAVQANGVVVVPRRQRVEIRRLLDGEVLDEVETAPPSRVFSIEKYIWVEDSQRVRLLSAEGKLVWERAMQWNDHARSATGAELAMAGYVLAEASSVEWRAPGSAACLRRIEYQAELFAHRHGLVGETVRGPDALVIRYTDPLLTRRADDAVLVLDVKAGRSLELRVAVETGWVHTDRSSALQPSELRAKLSAACGS